MNGPEHWRQAEARLDAAYQIAQPSSGHTDQDALTLIRIALQRAQVHATLAHAAAHLDAILVHPGDRREWDRAMGRTDEVTR